MKNTKFIIVRDVDIANKLIVSGFRMVSKTNDVYTFMNMVPQCFNFEEIDVKKLVYTDRLVF
jgi:hypothetical protein